MTKPIARDQGLEFRVPVNVPASGAHSEGSDSGERTVADDRSGHKAVLQTMHVPR
jgi:hypothetical protein